MCFYVLSLFFTSQPWVQFLSHDTFLFTLAHHQGGFGSQIRRWHLILHNFLYLPYDSHFLSRVRPHVLSPQSLFLAPRSSPFQRGGGCKDSNNTLCYYYYSILCLFYSYCLPLFFFHSLCMYLFLLSKRLSCSNARRLSEPPSRPPSARARSQTSTLTAIQPNPLASLLPTLVVTLERYALQPFYIGFKAECDFGRTRAASARAAEQMGAHHPESTSGREGHFCPEVSWIEPPSRE